MLSIDKKLEIKNLLKGMDEKDLLEVNSIVIDTLKDLRYTKSITVKSSLVVGIPVEWTGRKGFHKGVIFKINRTKAVVKVDGVNWTVPMSMLTVSKK